MAAESEIKLGFTCNNNCRFCLNADKRKLNDLNTEDIKKKILEAKVTGSGKIVFTGGEPAIRKDFLELCWFVRKLGMELGVHSNGRMFFYKEFAKQVSDLGIAQFLVSIHASDARLHNFLTQSRSFEQTVRGIRNLVKLKNRVITNTVINKYNMKNLKDTVKMISSLGVTRMQLTWPEPMGAALHDFDKIVPRFSEAAPYVKEAINTADNVYIVSIPICVLGQEYERFYVKHLDKKDFELSEVFESTKKNLESKTARLSKCKACSKKDLCEGVYKEYVKRYDSREIKPLK